MFAPRLRQVASTVAILQLKILQVPGVPLESLANQG
jgi:hypothetical protein